MTPPSPSSPKPGKLRRVVKRQKRIPKIEDLYREAYDRGMTVKEYVDYNNSMNADKTNRRNRSTSYNMGPFPFRTDEQMKRKK